MAKTTRRVHDAQFKTKVVLETLKGHRTLAQLSSEFGIHPTQITQWKQQALEGLPTLFNGPANPSIPDHEREQIEAPLFQQIGQLKVENDYLKKKLRTSLVGDRRQLIDPTHDRLSISQQCDLLDIARASYYYQPLGESIANLALMARIDKLFTDRPELGVRRMQQELTTAEFPVNLKRVRRLMRLMSLEAIYPKPNLSKPAEGHQIYPYLLKDVAIEGANHVWSTDITYIPMANGFLYLCAVIDWYTRFVLSWRLSNTLLVDFCLDALQDALKQWGKPQIFNTDQGSQFTSPRFLAPLQAAGIQISMDGKGRAIDNIFIERLWRTVKYEHIYLHAYPDGLALERGLAKYFHFYNYGRKHQSLDYQTPAQWYIEGGKGKKNTISQTAGIILN
ncbi:IS3 family transposase [Spirosoma sp. KUDC1026]|uniref:IS3 family transposase n=2 Tax=Spirosoma sp. KUDC1026 TaxID=2745947 RepID=UPI00397AEC66